MKTLLTSTCLVLTTAIMAIAGDASVTYFDASQVTAAFDKGAVLFEDAGANYMVHASRRETPGQCEIHAKDTDIIYMLDGTTTFVTGGTCVDPKPTGIDEVRGTAVENGEVRHLKKGDVVIVPHDTPHWFKEVDGPVLYYVVKVR